MPLKLAIAEDNSFALRACLTKLQPYPDCKVLVTAFNGEELLPQLPLHALDVILMDIEMPGMGGIACTRLVKEKYPHLKVLMLTTFDDEEKIFESILAGASGYLLKEEPADALHAALQEIVAGGAPMSAGIALKVLQLLRNPQQRPHHPPQDFGLTKREVELLEHLKNGLSYDQIGENLFISSGTVRKHIENIYRKLQVNNKVQAVKKAADNHLI